MGTHTLLPQGVYCVLLVEFASVCASCSQYLWGEGVETGMVSKITVTLGFEQEGLPYSFTMPAETAPDSLGSSMPVSAVQKKFSQLKVK